VVADDSTLNVSCFRPRWIDRDPPERSKTWRSKVWWAYVEHRDMKMTIAGTVKPATPLGITEYPSAERRDSLIRKANALYVDVLSTMNVTPATIPINATTLSSRRPDEFVRREGCRVWTSWENGTTFFDALFRDDVSHHHRFPAAFITAKIIERGGESDLYDEPSQSIRPSISTQLRFDVKKARLHDYRITLLEC
jgi:hypothetical protein